MKLQRPRVTPILPQWDLGIVLEALSKSPYEPLREASLKHLTLKTVFLLAMASAERRSELQVLVFDQKYIQYLTEHPELRKDRRRLFVSIKDNNAGKELSAATISRWICTTIVDSHAAMQNSNSIP